LTNLPPYVIIIVTYRRQVILMNINDLDKRVRLKEKRTFIITPKCECGGDFTYNADDVGSDLFSMFFSQSSNEGFKHKCKECSAVKKFKSIYPKEKSFEVGLDTTAGMLAEYVAKAYEEEFNDILGKS
jgi:hypothetical protein